MKTLEEIQTQIQGYERDIENIQQKIQQFNTALQRTIGAKIALEQLVREEEAADEPET